MTKAASSAAVRTDGGSIYIEIPPKPIFTREMLERCTRYTTTQPDGCESASTSNPHIVETRTMWKRLLKRT